ncbi:glycosyltransferase [uncultured Umboniibacter sp.]|uniref:glycosyltransferase n=1 Tax=uncultured Umboniibacter sp. TaxID=1798917 RepID=UPI002639F11E|nr:glycosyltransferase [uncultured Umboniibacter sp.]
MSGGAYIAAKRQCEALNEADVECAFLTIEHDWSLETSSYETTTDSDNPKLKPMMRKYKFADEFAQAYIEPNRSALSNSPFSIWRRNSETNDALLALLNNEGFTHVHFHYAPQLLNTKLLAQLKSDGIATFITCHDMYYFTGGCHYSATCERFQQNCNHCPQVSTDHHSLISHGFWEKHSAFSQTHANFVFPSQWMHDSFRRSAIGMQIPVKQCHTIRNCIDQTTFSPARSVNIQALRERFNIPADDIVVMAGAVDNTERRKGFEQLKTVLLATSKKLRELKSSRKITLITFGGSDQSKRINTQSIRQLALGSLSSIKVRDVMQCADVLLFTSSQDNYPNVVLEAIHCGTLVLATESGGTKELLSDAPHRTINTGSIERDCLELAELLVADDLPKWIRQAKVPSKSFLKNNSPRSVASTLSQVYQEALA